MAKEAVREFGSYKNHFEDVCDKIAEELEMIENFHPRRLRLGTGPQ